MNAADALHAAPLAAAWLAGLTGSVHCLAMCGGIAGALAMRGRAASARNGPDWFVTLAHHAGRLMSYAAAGALAGGLGEALAPGPGAAHIAQGLRIAAGVAIVLMGVRLAGGWNAFTAVERAGAAIWRHIAPFAMRSAKREGVLGALAVGACWGWLPCGLVYSMLLLATLGGSAMTGALTMTAFGAGTLLTMLPGSALATVGAGFLRRRGARRGAALVLIACGALTMWLPVAHLGTSVGSQPHAVSVAGSP